MTRTIRTLAAKLFIAGASLTTLAAPAVAFDQPANTPQTVPEAKKLTAKELHQKLLKSSGWIQQRDGDRILSHGTGWVLDAGRKLMVTNDHVVAGQDTVWVIFPKYKDGKLVRERAEYDKEKGVKATVIDRDRTRDLAVIQLDSLPAGIVALPLAADEPEEGDVVRTTGGYTNGNEDMVFGGVSGEVRSVGVNGGLHNAGKVRVVMSTVSINGGNSGGPLVNEAGELVGVNSYTVLRGWTGREVANTNGHISVKEFNTYFAEVDKLVEPAGAKEFVARGERKLKAARYDAAVKDFSAALGKDEKNAQALYLRGKAFTQTGDPRTGLEDLTAAIQLDGTKYEYRVARGMAQRALGKTDEAMADFSAAIRSDPAKSEGYNERGITTYRAGKYAEAEDDFARAIEKEPTDAVLWANRGDARFALKRYQEAAQDFAKAADLDPTNAGYVTALGNSLINAGKSQKAVELFVEAAKRWGNPVFLNRAGNALLGAADYKTAVKMYTDAIKAFGDKGDAFEVGMAYQGRGIAQRELKNFKEAIDDCTRAIDMHAGKNGYDYMHRGLAYQANGQGNAAEDDFAAAGKLGVKVERAAKGADTPAADSILGKWTMTYTANGVTVSQVIEFNKDGTWEGSTTLSTRYGSETNSDTGTWKMNKEKDRLTIRGKTTGTVVRTINLDGDEADVEMTEFGATVTFKRVK